MKIKNFALGALLLIAAPMRADFQQLGAGARAHGMGEAFSALADDTNAIVFNPAGLAKLSRAELSASYARLVWGLRDGSNLDNAYAAFAYPMRRYGTVGIGFQDMRLSSFFGERAVLLSYGYGLMDRLSFGVNLKLLQRRFGISSDARLASDPLFTKQGTGSQAFGGDLGMIYKFSKRFSMAASGINLNEPNLGLGSRDVVYRNFRLGAAYHSRDLNLAMDLVLRRKDWDVLLGTEKWFLNNTFGVRAGLGFGSRNDRDISTGFGYQSGIFQVDYAFSFPLTGITRTFGTHRLSFTVRFGKPRPLAPEAVEAPPEPAPIPVEVQEEIKTLRQEIEKSQKENEATRSEMEERLKKIQPVKPPLPSKKPAPQPEGPKTYIVSEGDSLESIAEKLYKDRSRWVEIYQANQGQIGVGGTLIPGQTLVVP